MPDVAGGHGLGEHEASDIGASDRKAARETPRNYVETAECWTVEETRRAQDRPLKIGLSKFVVGVAVVVGDVAKECAGHKRVEQPTLAKAEGARHVQETANARSAHCTNERAREVAPQMSAAQGGGAEGREHGIAAVDGLGHLLHVEEIARYKLKPRRLDGDLVRSAGEGGDLVALVERLLEEEPTDTASSPKNSKSHGLLLVVGGLLMCGLRYDGGTSGQRDTDLAQYSDLVDLKPQLRDLLVGEAVEDDRAVRDGASRGRDAGDGRGVDRRHRPARGALFAIDDDVFDGEAVLGEQGVDAIDCAANGFEAVGVAGAGVGDGVGCEDLGKDGGVVLVEALLVEAVDEAGVGRVSAVIYTPLLNI